MGQSDETTQGPFSTTEATARTIEGGLAYVADVARRLAPSFARSESRQRASASLRGWLSSAARKPSWQLAELCGEPTPDGFQYWLNRADWDADAGRDERGRAGPWNSSLKPRRAKWAWISTRSGAGRGGIGISRWRCGRWPCWRCCARGPSPWRRVKNVGRLPWRPAHWRRSRPNMASPPAERPRATAAAVAAGPGGAPDRSPHSGLVAVAPMASGCRPVLPL